MEEGARVEAADRVHPDASGWVPEIERHPTEETLKGVGLSADTRGASTLTPRARVGQRWRSVATFTTM